MDRITLSELSAERREKAELEVFVPVGELLLVLAATLVPRDDWES